MEHANLSPTCQISSQSAIVQITITSNSQAVLEGRRRKTWRNKILFLETFPSTFVSIFRLKLIT